MSTALFHARPRKSFGSLVVRRLAFSLPAWRRYALIGPTRRQTTLIHPDDSECCAPRRTDLLAEETSLASAARRLGRRWCATFQIKHVFPT